MDWTREGLAEAGFEGFVPFEQLPAVSVPGDPGVYVVLRVSGGVPVFRSRSPAGWFKGKDPSVPPPVLADAWVPDTVVLYIGKANAGRTGRRGLKKRLEEYRRHGAGAPVGHWGGRYIWQLVDSDRLLVAWRTTNDDEAGPLEAAFISEFLTTSGARPFANRKMGTKTR